MSARGWWRWSSSAFVGVSMVVLLASPAAAGSIKGVVQFVGRDVELRKLPVTIDQYVCGKDKEPEDLVLSREKRIRGAVVWLETSPPGVKPANPAAPVQIDQKQCVFIPRVIVVPAGGTVEFLNSDRLLHNIHSVSKENVPFNRTQPKGRTIPVVFAKPEIVRIKCDLHAWMTAWVVVAAHPFYALTDPQGEFVFDNVPAGRYVLGIWHERLGEAKTPVTVNGGVATVTVELGRK